MPLGFPNILSASETPQDVLRRRAHKAAAAQQNKDAATATTKTRKEMPSVNASIMSDKVSMRSTDGLLSRPKSSAKRLQKEPRPARSMLDGEPVEALV